MNGFNVLYAEQYDRIYAEKSYGSECDLIEAAIAHHGTDRPLALLDIGCGTGGHAIELAKRQYDVTGVDLSSHMLELARAKASSLPPSRQPTWLCGDAKTFDAGRQFDMAIMMFAVVGYLTTNDDVLAGLRNVRRHLKPGAPFVCDFWYGPSVLTVRPTDRVRVLPTSGGKVIRAASTTLDIAQHTADVTINLWHLEHDKLVSETCETHRVRYFFPQEFALMLTMAGFELRSMSAFPTLDKPLADDTWNALTVANAY